MVGTAVNYLSIYTQKLRKNPQLLTGLFTGVEKPYLTCAHENYIFVVLLVVAMKNKVK